MSDYVGSSDHQELSSDCWALKFLGVSYRKALLEAIDIDHSGYVSVQEVNVFTKAMPPEYT